jgi:putative FmdB family regulatory protein
MPVYEYVCLVCGAKADESQSIDAPQVVFCKGCEKGGVTTAMVRQPSAPNFTVKGKFTAKNGYSGR